MNKDEFKFNVNGISITNDSLYEVVPKPDYDAPSGYQDYGTTKLLHPLVSNKACCIFNAKAGVWDTGFFENSPCYKGMDKEEVKTLVKVLKERIVDPLERVIGEGKLAQTNHEFWDTYSPEIKRGKVFNTSEPRELLDLYMISRHRFIAPKGDSSKPMYRKAQFCIVNKKESTNIKQERKLNFTKAVGQAYGLIQNDRDKLDRILNYLNISSATVKDESTLNLVITNYLEDKKQGHQNVEIFLETVSKANTENGDMEIYLYGVLKNLYKKKKVTKEGIDFYYKDTKLGTNFKAGARLAALDLELQTELIEANED